MRHFRTMCANNSSSLEVSYNHITEFQPLLAIWLIDVPREILQIFDEVLKQVVLEGFSFYTNVNSFSNIILFYYLNNCNFLRLLMKHTLE